VEAWRLPGRKASLGADRLVSVLQCLAFAHDVLAADPEFALGGEAPVAGGGGGIGGGSSSSNGRDMRRVVAALYRRVLLYPDYPKVGRDEDHGGGAGMALPLAASGLSDFAGDASVASPGGAVGQALGPFLRFAGSAGGLGVGDDQARLLEVAKDDAGATALDAVWRDHLLAPPTLLPPPPLSLGGVTAGAEDLSAPSGSAVDHGGLGAYLPCPDVPASLVLDAALFPQPRATFRALALARKAGLAASGALLGLVPPSLAAVRLAEAIEASEPEAVAALSCAPVAFGLERALFTRAHVVRALKCFTKIGDGGRALAVLDVLSRHAPADTAPFGGAPAVSGLPSPAEFVAMLADAFAPPEAW
jgi:hypothetical protein